MWRIKGEGDYINQHLLLKRVILNSVLWNDNLLNRSTTFRKLFKNQKMKKHDDVTENGI